MKVTDIRRKIAAALVAGGVLAQRLTSCEYQHQSYR